MNPDTPAGRSERGPLETVVVVSSDGVIEQVTDDVAELLGWAPDQLVGRPLLTIIPERFHLSHGRAFERFVDTGQLWHHGQPLALPALRPDGTEVDIELILSSRKDAAGRLSVVGIVRIPASHIEDSRHSDDVIERIRQQLVHLIAADRPVGEVFEAALEPIGMAFDWSLGVLWAFDPWVERMVAMHIWERAPDSHPRYVEASRHIRFVSGEGFSTDMWRTQQATWSSDLAGEPDFKRAAAADLDGLRSAIFVPIVAATGMIGILELVDENRRDFDAETQRGLGTIADELGRHLAERLRRETEAIHRERLQLAMSGGRMGMWTFHIPTGQVTWDSMLEQLHGIAPGSFGGTFEAFAARIHSDDREGALAVVRAAVDERRSFEVSYRALGEDGSIRWIAGTGGPVFDRSGEMQVMVGVAVDETEEVLDRELLHRRATNATLAADVGRALVSDASVSDRLQHVVSSLVEHLDLAFARVWTLGDGDEVLRLAASAGMYTHVDGAHAQIPVGQWKIGRIAESRQSHVTNDVVNDDQISDPEWARREQMQAFVGHPLTTQGRCVGVLGVFSRRVLTADVIGALASITDSVAVAIAQHQEASRVRALLEDAREQRALALTRLRERQHVASVLQASLLPPDLPQIPGLDVQAAYRSGIEEVGGDFYDLFPLGDTKWGFMIGDVCGRGPEAARFTALARHTLRTALLLGKAPAKSLLTLDREIHSADTDGRFCTAVCGVVSTSADGAFSIRLSVAGHPPPLLRLAGGDIEQINTTGPLLGVVADAQFSEHTVELASGDALLLYTDGVVEARSQSGFFGDERLVQCLRDSTAGSAAAITDDVLDAVNSFNDVETQDDLAILTIRRV